MKTKIIGFVCGDISVTLYVIFAGIIHDFGGFLLKVLGVLIIGAAGGLAGMAAKDAYPIMKKYSKSFYRKYFKSPKKDTDE